ncbi:AbrB/MazE/SpoVT family DNA-binding domain-containing protein [Paenibacillus melissococcoides]|uniref:AbrB/MazE/SpoVT family DNA-binding domain-containing protein n=1 Tax=Paenibacillus TaxID=44249 RepID=UPI001B0FE159|nr:MULTISPECIES: AbrB/MazE/SpoVT family DNA-binding domain-containing protein [Paenibacillus]MEB9893777.1 AbrB/MazE/SpoVT family DNA-binding domain-containing protein [Bacillus cereus]GIO79528.1 AbrB family transcriptional regulator [Paenibacillus dendritiformis]CAH8718737.1 AbrB/MazE/SpoVT family DNA-binding domain-containing protein [Paenibacillus melissococcoides]CAH8719742.1 AbrB/MazE/SpoVT family DNA-binding domain-containing protein [Paenibacillus melissococcoides]
MKSTGIVRNLDSLGHIVIPMELRRTLNIDSNAAIEIYTDGERIVLQKHVSGCSLCGLAKGSLKTFGRGIICFSCINLIADCRQQLLEQPNAD